ncbi:DUF3043 domain-containing protein [Corynebacterium otitidis]|uniref:DUF3043 domain-containing protein n=1 Tax=Corynebacterium otitidis ATCC 51513 TaxID=883169 RepID=I7KIJ5_9CORY|nr:DUF3043 domain-containing protein [Corynebacterium otitidis]EJZ82795.1 hypothetical protein HMPREF9719_00287 [Corynebacterium otitidis ATCC 51513]CCI82985.1 hypothetical protein BN46_0237 [Corynebacterium otitidis ATCC 51513]
MKLPWKKTEGPADTVGSAAEVAEEENAGQDAGERPLPKGYTPPKGRPTPKRKDREIERGVLRGASQTPTTPGQARKKRKELKNSMSKQEWKEHKRKQRIERREQQIEVQKKMDAGDPRYMLARDQGPVRAYLRDWVDARRFAGNYILPFALGLLVIMFISSWFPTFASIVSLISMVMIVVFAAEAFIAGRRANASARKKFPDPGEKIGFGTGFYVFGRLTQPRRWRSPKPRVEVGDKSNEPAK